jgi:alkylation response protein AidB-like acyl-CoA dehydrogenase
MDFSISQDQIDVRDLAAQILSDHCDNDQLRRIEEQDEVFHRGLWKALAEAGLLGVAIPEENGGTGLGFETACLLIEEAGRVAAPLPLIPVLIGAALPLARFGNAAQRQRWLPGVADGSLLLSAALIEPLNEDYYAPETRAERNGDDAWEITGVKNCVPIATSAERVLLAANSNDGVVLGWLDPKAPGVTLLPQATTAHDPLFELRAESAIMALEDVLAVGEDAIDILHWIWNRSSAATCAHAVGTTEAMVRMTAEYTSQRKQFGVAIATFQAVGHRAADCFIDVECLRLATAQAVSLLNHEQDAEEAILVARIWCADVTHRISQASQHLHGGTGVDRDYPLFRYCLRCKQLELTHGGAAESLAALGTKIAASF